VANTSGIAVLRSRIAASAGATGSTAATLLQQPANCAKYECKAERASCVFVATTTGVTVHVRGSVRPSAGDDGLLARDDGLYAGDDGQYAGEVGLYAGEVGLYGDGAILGGDGVEAAEVEAPALCGSTKSAAGWSANGGRVVCKWCCRCNRASAIQ
jgi:hypothetical protein